MQKKDDQDIVGWLDETCKLNDILCRLEAYVKIAKNVYNMLLEKVVGLDK